MAEAPRVLYIMGRGRSGSTLLAALLGYIDGAQNVGELIYPMDKECSCEKPFSRCEFWQQVRTQFEADSGLDWEQSRQLIQQQAYIAKFGTTLLAGKQSPTTEQLQTVNKAIIQAILHVAKKQLVIDASKEPTRGLFLMRQMPDIKFVHIVRRPEGVIASYLHRIRKGSIKFLRHEYHGGPLNFLFLTLICASWVWGNLLVEFVRLFGPTRVLRIRYEDLCTAPHGELQRLQLFLDRNFDSLIDAVEHKLSMPIGHVIGGNARMRSGDTFIFDPQVGTSRELPWVYKLMVRAVAWPMMLFYGYPIFSRSDMPQPKAEIPLKVEA